MKHISYPKIPQFRTVVSTISKMIAFVGLDDNGDAMYDPTIKKPTLTFKGTVKIHGTNASFCFNSTDGFWAQSRKNVITVGQDNAGFAMFCETNKVVLSGLLDKVINKHQIDTKEFTVSIYGEWAGGSIQKNVGVAQLEKAFYMFGIKVSKPSDPDFVNYWLPSGDYRFESDKIWNITEFETYEVDIDFNMPKLAQNKMLELTTAVGDECPVAKHFGVSGIGEGIVWEIEFKGTTHRFKTKDDRHAGKSKIKTIKKVDNVRLQKIMDTANEVTPVWRLNQMFNEVTNNGENIDRKLLSDYIRMVIRDVLEEDLDIIAKAELEPKDINKYVSQYAREYFFEQEAL
jgi:hypothetical protein